MLSKTFYKKKSNFVIREELLPSLSDVIRTGIALSLRVMILVISTFVGQML